MTEKKQKEKEIVTQCGFCHGLTEFDADKIPKKRWKVSLYGLRGLARYLKIHDSTVIINGKVYRFEKIEKYRQRILKRIKKIVLEKK